VRIHVGRLLFVALLAAVMLSIPLSWVDHGPSWCLLKAVSGHECPGCGMTRALMHAMRGDLAAAWQYNWRWVLVAPLLLLASLRWLMSPAKGSRNVRAVEEPAIPSPSPRELMP
jgi:hypothetical protein